MVFRARSLPEQTALWKSRQRLGVSWLGCCVVQNHLTVVLCGESPVFQSGVGGCVVQNQRCFAANRQCCRVGWVVAWFRTRGALRRIASVAEWGRWLRGSEPEILCGESPVLRSGVGGCVVENQVSALRRGVGTFCCFFVFADS